MATPLVRTGDLGRIVATYVTSVLALALAAAVLPGLRFTSFQQLLATAAAALLIGALVRPVLVAASAAIGWLAVLLLAFLGQAVILAVALTLIPGVEADSFWVVLAAAWIVAAATTIVAWLCTSGTPEAFTAALVRRTRRRRTPVDDPEAPGVIFVQLDGVPFPVLRWQLLAATLPTVGRWIRDGGYRLVEWTPVLPPTTPASQLGILHGRIDGVPAFRWYDRALGRVLVANRAADAAEIEAAPLMVAVCWPTAAWSISNLFSGDAERSVLTMSKIERRRFRLDTRRRVGWFFARPDGFRAPVRGGRGDRQGAVRGPAATSARRSPTGTPRLAVRGMRA